MDTTAFAQGLAELHGKEKAILGYNPPCDNPVDRRLEGRWYYSPETGPPKFEDPIVEGSTFTDITSGCGSHLGRPLDGFSLFLLARDTRLLDGPGNVDSSGACTNGIVDCKLNKLREALNSFTCIGSKTQSDLKKILDSAIHAFDVRSYALAIKRLESFNSAVGGGDSQGGG